MDALWMRRALDLARRGAGRVAPNPMVGAVVVRDGRIVGEGYHGQRDADHAEVIALEAAGDAARGATLYVTLEPCAHFGKTPPCTRAIMDAGISRVVAPVLDPNPLVSGKGRDTLEAAGIPVDIGLGAEEAARLNEAYLHWRRTGRPFVIAKWAMTLDGRVATATGASRYLTGAPARAHVHELRAASSAVMVGVGTVLADDPELTVRLARGTNPLRIVVDSHLRIPGAAKVLHPPGETLILAAEDAPKERRAALRAEGATILALPSGARGIDLGAAFQALGARSIISVLVEGGPTLHGSLFDEGLVDKCVIYLAPKLLGGEGALGPIGGRGASQVEEALDLEAGAARQLGRDLVIEAYPKRKA